MSAGNFAILRRIVVDGVKDAQDRTFLNMVEAASKLRSESTDWITKKLDDHHIRVRLTK